MPSFLTSLKYRAFDVIDHFDSWIDKVRGSSHLVKADFKSGGKTMHSYLRTHRNKYHRNVGAHFLMKLYEAGPEVLADFSEKQRLYGWHFTLTAQENTALRAARDETCSHSHIAGLRYSTNVFNQLANKKQMLRMLGLGAAAGSAGILLGLSELFFFAKEASKDLISSVLGVSWETAPAAANSEFISLANEITQGAVNSDGSLDAEIVAERIADLVTILEDAGNAETVVKYMTADTSYIVGIISGIAILVIGRGMVQLILEGVNGTVTKIDALVHDMDEFCNWKLGRSPFPYAESQQTGRLLMGQNHTLIRSTDAPADHRAS